MSAHLEDLLSQTLLFSASPTPRIVPASFSLTSLVGGRPDVGSFESPSHRKIWEYQLDGVDSVRNVTVRHREMRDMRMNVCREIKWGDVKVLHQGKTFSLPLTEKFLLRTYFLAEGTVPESEAGYWQLPMNLDQSFQRLFGFELKAGQLRPLSPTELDSQHLLAKPSLVAFNRVREGEQQSTPLRLLVCMALGCAKERNDFEPGGVLGAARLLPHIMIVANMPVESMESTLQLARDPTTLHTQMDNEEMSPRISPALFTDRNGNLTPYPTWDNLFDYYWIDPPLRTEMKVVRRDRPHAREKTGLINEAVAKPTSRGTAHLAYKARTVKKVPRQGEFDNIHFAPKMKLPASVLRKVPNDWPRETTMAPFCIHDCFHIHWRWGEPGIKSTVPKWVHGWSKNAPHSVPGAPMVPPNQDVSITLLDACKLEYKAKIHAPEAGRWQIVMHHGAAYALSTAYAAKKAPGVIDALTTSMRGETGKEGKWANFYWHLRYTLLEHPLRAVDPTNKLVELLDARDTYAERLAWDTGGFRAVRDL